MSATLGYILKLLILIPLVAGLAWGSLWLWRRAQQGIGAAGRRVALGSVGERDGKAALKIEKMETRRPGQ